MLWKNTSSHLGICFLANHLKLVFFLAGKNWRKSKTILSSVSVKLIMNWKFKHIIWLCIDCKQMIFSEYMHWRKTDLIFSSPLQSMTMTTNFFHRKQGLFRIGTDKECLLYKINLKPLFHSRHKEFVHPYQCKESQWELDYNNVRLTTS